MLDHEYVWRYVERFFAAHSRTEWPTVRRVARSLRWTQQRVSDAVDGDPDGRTFLSSYQGEYPLGEHFVESSKAK
jgi:hypothetical protein